MFSVSVCECYDEQCAGSGDGGVEEEEEGEEEEECSRITLPGDQERFQQAIYDWQGEEW